MKPSKTDTQEIVSFSVVQRDGGWSLATTKTLGNKLISQEFTQPDMKSIAIHAYRIASAKEFMGAK